MRIMSGSDHSGLILTWLGMHRTANVEWPRICSIFPQQFFTRGEFPSYFSLSLSLWYVTVYFSFQLFWGFWVLFLEVVYTNCLPRENNYMWARQQNMIISGHSRYIWDALHLSCTDSRCDLPSILARYRNSLDISVALIPCLNRVTVTICVYVCRHALICQISVYYTTKKQHITVHLSVQLFSRSPVSSKQ